MDVLVKIYIMTHERIRIEGNKFQWEQRCVLVADEEEEEEEEEKVVVVWWWAVLMVRMRLWDELSIDFY